jgi:hypothetical protein
MRHNQTFQENTMTIEATLTRAFGINFIDATALATEAKLNLGITCYPTKAQKERLDLEASRLYDQQLETIRRRYQQRRMLLESAKSSSEFPESSVDDFPSTELSGTSCSRRGFPVEIIAQRLRNNKAVSRK